jgi:hypothetical protein
LRLQALEAQSVPDVRLTKAVSKAVNKEGGLFNYTFSVNNLGALNPGDAGTAYNVIVSDNFPVGIAPTSNYWIEPNGATNGEFLLLLLLCCCCAVNAAVCHWHLCRLASVRAACALAAAMALLAAAMALLAAAMGLR